MALSYVLSLRNAQLDQITTAVGNGGKLYILSGVRPATGGPITTVLAQFTLGSPFAPPAVSAVLSPTLPAPTVGIANGVATWYRITKADDSFVMDGNAGLSGTDMTLSNVNISIGTPVEVLAHTIGAGNG